MEHEYGHVASADALLARARGALGVELPPRRDLTRRRVLGAGVRDRGGFQLGLLF